MEDNTRTAISNKNLKICSLFAVATLLLILLHLLFRAFELEYTNFVLLFSILCGAQTVSQVLIGWKKVKPRMRCCMVGLLILALAMLAYSLTIFFLMIT